MARTDVAREISANKQYLSTSHRVFCIFIVVGIWSIVIVSRFTPLQLQPMHVGKYNFRDRSAQDITDGNTLTATALQKIVAKTVAKEGIDTIKDKRLNGTWEGHWAEYRGPTSATAISKKRLLLDQATLFDNTLDHTTRANNFPQNFSLPQIKFLSNYKNPCWWEDLLKPNVYDGNAFTRGGGFFKALTEEWTQKFEAQGHPRRLRCLPYFFLAGQPKCGTTDLYEKLTSHPDIAPPPIKEPHWWTKYRFGWHSRGESSAYVPFKDYVDLFDKAALSIGRIPYPSASHGEQEYHQTITGDGSASTFWFNDYWGDLPENADRTETFITNAHHINSLLPNSRIIVIMRDPTERLYSDYLFFHRKRMSAGKFHTGVRRAIDVYERCMKTHSIRSCAYNKTIARTSRVRLRIGMYFVFLKEWLHIFPKHQIHIVRLEDYASEPLAILKKIFKFLGLRALSKSEERDIFNETEISNSRRKKALTLGDMRPDTRELLKSFYLYYNKKLSILMQDHKYLWKSG